jgi:HSP20 family protein
MQSRGTRGYPPGLARRQQFGLSPWADPFTVMRSLTEEMDRLFEDFGLGGMMPRVGRGLAQQGAGAGPLGQTGWSPQIEVFQREGQLVMRADLPGLNKEDVKVEITDDALTLRGERRQEHEENREGFFRSERSYGSFYRSIPLPDGVNGEEAQATFRNGVLEVTIPVTQQHARSRQLDIRDASQEEGTQQQRGHEGSSGAAAGQAGTTGQATEQGS